MSKQEVFNVVVWFNNGESRVFGATKVFQDDTGFALKHPDGGVTMINDANVAVVYNPTREWSKYWDE